MKSKILFVLCLLMGLLFINSGLDKFLHYMPMPKNMPEKMVQMGNAFKEISWLMPLVGLAEILGGILIIPSRTRALGALILIPILVGILLTAINIAPSILPLVIILWAIMIWVIIDNKNKYSSLI